MRRKAAEAEAPEQPGATSIPEPPARSRASQTWATLIKRVYEIDPLCCPKCQGQMKVIAFIEPPQADVIEKILRHCGLWHCSRAPPAEGDFVHDGHSQASPNEPRELTFVAEDLIWDEAEGFLDADPFSHTPADQWYRQSPGDEPQELTFVDEDTFWSES